MDLALVQSYIAFKAPSPHNMRFLFDVSCIAPTSGHLDILGRDFDIVPYEGDLQIRSLLEEYKDAMQDKRFCIVSSKNDDENLLISDYIAHSDCVFIDPRTLLEFSQKGYHWPEEVNQLRGPDFWEHMERLQKFRENLPRHISPAECNNIILSAVLNTDFSRVLLPSEAIGLQKRLDTDERIRRLRQKYPALVDALEQMVHEAIPLMAKIGQDEDLAKFLWVSYSLSQRNDNYELFLPRILGREIWQKYGEIPLDRAREICQQLIDRDTERVIEQIKTVEQWLSQDKERMRVFREWLGVSSGSLVKTAEFAATEEIFCIPLKESLRTVARAIISSSVSPVITTQLRGEIL